MRKFIRWRLAPIVLAVASLAGMFAFQASTAEVASAAPVQDFWIATGNGTIQGIHDGNHYWAEKYNSLGQMIGRAYDVWLPYYCNAVWWQSGNFYNGTPAIVRFGNWNGQGGYHTGENGYRGCYRGSAQTTYQGWAEVIVWPQGCHNTGNCQARLGVYSGANYFNPSWVNNWNDCNWNLISANCTRGDHYVSYYSIY